MSYLKERVSYLKGLAEGMQISDSTNEGKLLKAIIEVLDDMALSVEEVEEVQDQINDQIDSIDEDLAEVERMVFDCEEEEELDSSDFECPYCGEVIIFNEELLDDDGEELECPHCHKKIEVDWTCDCEDCHDDEEK